MANPLTPQELEEALAALPPHWAVLGGRLVRTIACNSYAETVALALRVALLAEAKNHHPDTLTVAWKKLEVAYVTHSAGGITALDVAAAQEISRWDLG